MNQESKQKLSALALHGTLTYAMTALIVIGSSIAYIQRDSAVILSGIIMIVGLSVVVGFLVLRFLDRFGWQFSDSYMAVARPFGSLHIAYDSVSRVERVTKTNARKTEKVRITFRHLGKERVLTITPAFPAIVASEILLHCSQLTSIKACRLKRDHSFRAAREMV